MVPRKSRCRLATLLLLLLCWLGAPPPAAAQPAPDPAGRHFLPSADYRPPADVGFRSVTILSEGVRLHGELFWPRAATGRKLPTIVMANGWGGLAAVLRPDASDLAEAGYLVLLFDYRGWGESDGRVVLNGPAPAPSGTFTAQVTMLRGYVDPFEQVADWFNAIDWLAGEPMADMTRLGLRGTSFSGGHVIYVAAHDPRVRAIVSQVPGIAPRPAGGLDTPSAQAARERATRMARGELGYPPPGERLPDNLVGAPVGDKLLRWWPNEDASQLTAAALFIRAEYDEFPASKEHVELAYQRATGPKRLVVIPGIRHFDIYGRARGQAIRLAIDWFDQYLKPPR